MFRRLLENEPIDPVFWPEGAVPDDLLAYRGWVFGPYNAALNLFLFVLLALPLVGTWRACWRPEGRTSE